LACHRKELLASFASVTDRERIENIEEMIYEAFFVGGARRGVVKRQLSRWMGTSSSGRQSRGYAEVKALYDFLNPETSRAEKAPQ